jgi:hypothetical protein
MVAPEEGPVTQSCRKHTDVEHVEARDLDAAPLDVEHVEHEARDLDAGTRRGRSLDAGAGLDVEHVEARDLDAGQHGARALDAGQHGARALDAGQHGERPRRWPARGARRARGRAGRRHGGAVEAEQGAENLVLAVETDQGAVDINAVDVDAFLLSAKASLLI